MQVLTYGGDYLTYYRWGKTGEKGEWVLRGNFIKKKALEIYNDKVREKQQDIAKINGIPTYPKIYL
jgi:hypothetical protein